MADPKITFKAWFIVTEDNIVKMVDSASAAVHCGDEEEWFGPYPVTIPMPGRIKTCLQERGQTIEGVVGDG